MKIEALQNTQVSTASMRNMAHVLVKEGLDLTKALRDAGVGAQLLADPDGQVDGVTELAFQHAFIEQTKGRPDLWVKVGQGYRILHYGVAGLAAMTSPDLDDMCRTSGRWRPLFFTLASVRPIESYGVIIGFEFDMTEVPEFFREFTIYRDIGAWLTFTKDLGLHGLKAEIEVVYSEPEGWCGRNIELPDITFDAARSVIVWGQENALLPLPYADAMLHESYLRQCDDMVRAIYSANSFVQSVIEVLAATNEGHSIETTSRKVGVSKRTLQRRLNEHSLTFHDLLGTVRARQAQELLTASELPIAEIAWRMGYADATGFSHAFRRWTGLSPRAFRKRQDGAAEGAPSDQG